MKYKLSQKAKEIVLEALEDYRRWFVPEDYKYYELTETIKKVKDLV